MILLIPSPLLGSATWRPVEAWLRGEGHRAQAVDFGAQPRTPAGVLDAVAAAAGNQTVVLVPHSNAGLYAPYLASVVDVAATVFVDAALPGQEAERGETQLAPPAFLDFLRSLADPHGVLPPWTEWWDDVDDLFPDASVRQAVEREQQRLPLTYFTSRIPVPSGWTEHPAAYVAFGETYAEERERAARLGWPTRTIAGSHLHALHDPASVGASILDLSRVALGSNRPTVVSMDEDVRRELDELRRRIAELENMLTRLAGIGPIDPMPPGTDPLRHPQPPPPGDYPRSST